MELRGRLSNPGAVEAVELASQAVAARAADGGGHKGASAASPPPSARRWRLIDRLGEKIILDLLADSRAGATKQVLVERYSISMSSVKRLLRIEQRR